MHESEEEGKGEGGGLVRGGQGRRRGRDGGAREGAAFASLKSSWLRARGRRDRAQQLELN